MTEPVRDREADGDELEELELERREREENQDPVGLSVLPKLESPRGDSQPDDTWETEHGTRASSQPTSPKVAGSVVTTAAFLRLRARFFLVKFAPKSTSRAATAAQG